MKQKQLDPRPQRMSLTVVICLTLTFFISGVENTNDICHNLNTATLKAALHPHSTPKAGSNAGNYTRDGNSTSVPACIASCCAENSCNYMFYFNKTCYLLQCNTLDSRPCDPVNRTEAKFNGSYYVEVRPVNYPPVQKINRVHSVEGTCNPQSHVGCQDDEECRFDDNFELALCYCRKGFVRDKDTKKCIESSSSGEEHAKKSRIKVCVVDVGSQCGTNEECLHPEGAEDLIGVCVCKEGFHRNHEDKCAQNADSTTPGSTSKPDSAGKSTYPISKMKACEYGLRQCGEHQECFIPENSLKKAGLCVCVEGYSMDDEANCFSSSTTTPQVRSSTKETTTTKKVSPSKVTTATTTTTTTTTTPAPVPADLTVSAGKDIVLQLPENTVTLHAYVMEKEKIDFHYEWTLIASPSGAETGTMVGKNTDHLKLTKLIAGLYTFQIKVTGKNMEGSDFVNVTVLPEKRKNTPPVAVIKPKTQVVKLPNSAILDGSDSTDDDKIVKYHWEEMSGPIQDQKIKDDTAMLTLKGLAPGSYKFKLTVTDSDGVSDSATTNVTFIKETDYPPKANAGSDIIIGLPQNTVKLCGNGSTDDKGISSYEWIKTADDKLTADMAGVRSECLTLSKLQKGDYTFTLKVTDTAGQVSSADVHVFVKPEVNRPPVAVTAQKKTIFLPQSYLLLDGHNSTDDKGITAYKWEQISGPTNLKIDNATKSIAKATGDLQVGEYEFKLTAADAQKLQSSAELSVTVKKRINKPPESHAGGDKTLNMPCGLVSLDGSKSSDDKKIVTYSWTRDPKSLAAGDVLNNSDHHAVLQLVNLVSGRYIFSLTVTDEEGLKSTDSASLVINEDPHSNDMMEILIDADIKQFTQEDKVNLQHQLSLMMPKSINGDTRIVIQSVENVKDKGLLKITFYVTTVQKDYLAVRSGVETLSVLKEKIKDSGSHILNFHVMALDTVVCQKNCSGHGVCDMKTKLCVCEAFWMQNFFIYYMLDGESNCDWSVLYVVIVTFLCVVGIAAVVWGIICFCKKRRFRCRWRTKKRHRYSLLQEVDYKDEMEMIPKEKIQNSSVMISESDFTSDGEETLFVNHKKINGYLQKPPNGINKHIKTKLKT